jgi:hypothetical protein
VHERGGDPHIRTMLITLVGFSETAGWDALVDGSCTTCQVTQDKSAYWTAALYFQSSTTGEFTLVEQVGGMLAYVISLLLHSFLLCFSLVM